jgi:hypothetical protein
MKTKIKIIAIIIAQTVKKPNLVRDSVFLQSELFTAM